LRSALVTTDRYTRVAIALHWSIAALILFNLWLGLAHGSLPREWQVMPVHKAVGITVLALTLARIAWRLTHLAPAVPLDTPRWQRAAAHLSHYGLYAFMLIMPLTGWAMVSGAETRRPLTWFFLFDIPYLPVSKAVAGVTRNAHELFGWLMLSLVALHVAAALWHHFFHRDTVLARMTPLLRAR
jgi:cytochrome b561